MAKVNKEEIKKNVLNKKVFFAALFLIVVSVSNVLIGKYIIPIYATNRVSPNDLFFTYFPYVEAFPQMDAIISALIIITFVYSSIKSEGKYVYKYLVALGIMYTIRGVVILFNPFAVPHGVDLSIVNTDSVLWDNGFFFSGHTSFYLLTYLYTSKEYKILKNISLILFIAGIIVILFARHHYLIDIYGGIVTSLLIFEYMKRERPS